MGISHKSKKRAAFGSLSLQFLLEKPDESIPSKGRQPKPDEKPGGDQMPTGRISVAKQYQIWERPIGQKRGSSPKGAGGFFPHFWAAKNGAAGGKTALKTLSDLPGAAGGKQRKKKEGGQGAPLPLASFFSLHRGRSTAAAGYLCLPWKNSAIVPGPEWLPMTGPT